MKICWNPWRRIRDLQMQIMLLEDRLEYERQEANYRIGQAIEDHYRRMQREDRYRTADLAALQESLRKVTAFSWPSPVMPMTADQAAALGIDLGNQGK